MICESLIIQLAVMDPCFVIYFAIMVFDGLFQIVNVDELDVKLVVVMFYFC